MKPTTTMETERLRLRPPVPEVTRYVTWRPHRSVDDTREFLLDCAAWWDHDGPFTWVITLREEGRLVGAIEIVRALSGWALAQPDVHAPVKEAR